MTSEPTPDLSPQGQPARLPEPSPTTVPSGIPAIEAATHAPEPSEAEVLIITGMSGAGRTRAAAVLEDLDWYVVDNLPPRMIVPLVDLMTRSGSTLERIAAVVDVRGREFFTDLVEVLDHLRQSGVFYRILFLDASDEVLVRRYEQVRRPHPLQGEGRILDGLAEERRLLASLEERSDVVIDTSELTVHDLAREVRAAVADGTPRRCASTWSPSGSSTGCRSTRTTWSTCGSSRTPTGSPSCATSRAATRPCATTCSDGPAPSSSSTGT